MISKLTPLGALIRGIGAGVVGAFAIGAALKAAQKYMPQSADGFAPPEAKQRTEQPTETVARRVVEGMMQRGPLSADSKGKGGMLVHLAFGAAWGGVYGVVHGSHRALRGPLGVLGFGTAVWAISDGIILPAFRLAPPLNQQPARTHLLMWLAHLAYGGAVWAAFEGALSKTWMPVIAPVAARLAVRNVPELVRPTAYRVLESIREQRPARRLRDAALALATA